MNPKKRPYKILRLVQDEGCNTSADIADALGLASECVIDLIKAGRLRRTGATIPNPNGHGRKYLCFEAVRPAN